MNKIKRIIIIGAVIALLIAVIAAIHFYMIEKAISSISEVAESTDIANNVHVVEMGKDAEGNSVYGYEVDDTLSWQIEKRLSEIGMSPSAYGLSKDSELLNKLLQSEITTSQPDLSNGKEIQGEKTNKKSFQGDIKLHYGDTEDALNGMIYLPENEFENKYNELLTKFEKTSVGCGNTSYKIVNYNNVKNATPNNNCNVKYDVINGNYENGELKKIYTFEMEDDKGIWDANKYPSLYQIAYGTPSIYNNTDLSLKSLPQGITTWDEYNVDAFLSGESENEEEKKKDPNQYFTLDSQNNIIVFKVTKQVQIKGNNTRGTTYPVYWNQSKRAWNVDTEVFYAGDQTQTAIKETGKRQLGTDDNSEIFSGNEHFIDTRDQHKTKYYTRTVTWTIEKEYITNRQLVANYATPFELPLAMYTLNKVDGWINDFLDTIIEGSRIDVWVQNTKNYNEHSVEVQADVNWVNQNIEKGKDPRVSGSSGILNSCLEDLTTTYVRKQAILSVKTWAYSKKKHYEKSEPQEEIENEAGDWLAVQDKEMLDYLELDYSKLRRQKSHDEDDTYAATAVNDDDIFDTDDEDSEDVNDGYREVNIGGFRYLYYIGAFNPKDKNYIFDKTVNKDGRIGGEWYYEKSDSSKKRRWIYLHMVRSCEKSKNITWGWQEVSESSDDSETILVDPFLRLWMNATGNAKLEYKTDSEGNVVKDEKGNKIALNDKFDKKGKLVKYGEQYGSDLLKAKDEFWNLLSKSERTQGYDILMKYLFYIYTGEDYGVTDVSQVLDFMKNRSNYYTVQSTIGSESLLEEFIKSWENNAMRKYINGDITDYNSNQYIYKCITEDKQYYKMCPVIGSTKYAGQRNYGFGICYYANGKFMNESYFAEEGINIKDPKYNTYEKSMLPVDLVERIKRKMIQDNRTQVEKLVKKEGITLTDYQMDALVDTAYQFGVSGSKVANFIHQYKLHGLTNSLRNACNGMDSSTGRYEARWILFTTGKYMAPEGEELLASNLNSTTTMVPGTGGTVTAVKGDGYTQVYTASYGAQFKCFKQYEGTYQGHIYDNGGTIGDVGCSITSIAIVLSGYGKNVTPDNLRYHSNLGNHFTQNGVSIETSGGSYYGKADKNKIMTNLANGKPMIISIRGTLKVGNALKDYSKYGHYIALLDVKGTNEVYVSDPGANNSKTNGWAKIDDIIKIVNRGVIYTTKSCAKSTGGSYSSTASASVGTSNFVGKSKKEKLNILFPNGIPKTESQMSKYMVTIDVPITTKSGKKTTQKLTVHKAVASDVKAIFQTIQNSGFKIYAASAYCYRLKNNGNPSSGLSHHSYGIAIDINVTENFSRIVNSKGQVIKKYAGDFWNPSSSEYSIPKNGVVVKTFKAKGWLWGGEWSGNYQDYMHFSLTGE